MSKKPKVDIFSQELKNPDPFPCLYLHNGKHECRVLRSDAGPGDEKILTVLFADGREAAFHEYWIMTKEDYELWGVEQPEENQK